MERQIVNADPKPSVLADDLNASPKILPDWRAAIKELRDMLRNEPSLEDEFIKQRRSEKW